jgi:general secretion pathway protein K
MNCRRSDAGRCDCRAGGPRQGGPRQGRRRQGGAALVVALLVFALCTALIVAMESEFDRLYRREGNILLAEQAQAYLRGAEELASLALIVDYDQDRNSPQPRDDLQEIWAQPTDPYPLEEGGWLQGSLEDLQGRFNLNTLAARARQGEGEPRFTAAQSQFIRLLQALGEPAVSLQDAIAITESIGDWLDPDGNQSPGGAEDDYYLGRTPPYRTANRPMASASELLAVANVTPELYRALEPWVTVWPLAPAPLNIHTAPAMVLRSINADEELAPLSEEEGQALVEQRETAGFAGVDDLLASPVFAGREGQMAEVKGLLGERSSCFLMRAEAEVARRRMRLYSVLERRNRRVTAIVRASGSL